MKSLLILTCVPIWGAGQVATKALADLQHLLHTEKEWVKVHAAEFLLWEDRAVDEVRKIYLQEEQLFGDVPKYRIGIWRVLAQAAADDKDRQYWVDKIVTAYQDPEGEDRLHAIETLAKLKIPVVQRIDDSLEGSMRIYSLWNYATASKQQQEEVKAILLEDLFSGRLSELETLVTSFVLRYLGPLSNDEHQKVYEWLESNNFDTSLSGSLLATLWMTSPVAGDQEAGRASKTALLAFGAQSETLNNVMMALAVSGDKEDKEMICRLYDAARKADHPDYNSDLHATAAYMLLKTARRGVFAD